MASLEDVFGIRTKPVLSYVERSDADGKLKDAIRTDHHIIIYGSSKQGKTALRQKCIPENNCVVVRCSPKTTMEQIYSSILRQTEINIQTIETETVRIDGKVTTKLGFKALIPWMGGGTGEVGAEISGGGQRSFTSEFVSFDYGEAQSVAELLNKLSFKKFIVIENFHYLPVEIQRQLAFDLKTFHETNIRFIILGIWREANHIVTNNPDLDDRVIEIPVEPWLDEDFRRVVTTGAKELGVEIRPEITDRFLANAFGNIGMFQEFLKTFCKLSGVTESGPPKILGDIALAEQTLIHRLEVQRPQFTKIIQGIAARSRTRHDESDPLLLPFYLVKLILHTPVQSLIEGIDRGVLLDKLREIHHRENKNTIRGGDITNLLTRLPSLQEDSPLLYYDANDRRLKIVDTRQFFVLSRADLAAIENDIAMPGEDYI